MTHPLTKPPLACRVRQKALFCPFRLITAVVIVFLFQLSHDHQSGLADLSDDSLSSSSFSSCCSISSLDLERGPPPNNGRPTRSVAPSGNAAADPDLDSTGLRVNNPAGSPNRLNQWQTGVRSRDRADVPAASRLQENVIPCESLERRCGAAVPCECDGDMRVEIQPVRASRSTDALHMLGDEVRTSNSGVILNSSLELNHPPVVPVSSRVVIPQDSARTAVVPGNNNGVALQNVAVPRPVAAKVVPPPLPAKTRHQNVQGDDHQSQQMRAFRSTDALHTIADEVRTCNSGVILNSKVAPRTMPSVVPPPLPAKHHGYQRSVSSDMIPSNLNSIVSANVVGLPNHPRHGSVPAGNTGSRNAAGSGGPMFAHHPRNSSEPSPVTPNHLRNTVPNSSDNRNISCANIVSILNHHRHIPDAQGPYRSASVPKGVVALDETSTTTTLNVNQNVGTRLNNAFDSNQIGGCRSIINSAPERMVPNNSGSSNVSNVDVTSFYRAVPVNVVSNVPTIKCLNTNTGMDQGNNVSNVNIVQAMPSSSATVITSQMVGLGTTTSLSTTMSRVQIPHPENSAGQVTVRTTQAYLQVVPTHSAPVVSTVPSGSSHILVPSMHSVVPVAASSQIVVPVSSHVVPSAAQVVVHAVPIVNVSAARAPSSSQMVQNSDQEAIKGNGQEGAGEVQTRTFTSTEAQTDDSTVGAALVGFSLALIIQ